MLKMLSWSRFAGLPLLAAGMLVTALGKPVHAHPHAFIDFDATIRLDDSNQVDALAMTWVFDDFYSAFIISDVQENGGDLQEGLLEVARINLVNLQEYGYFADIRADDKPLEVEDVTTFETGIEDGRVWLKFELRPKTKIDPRESVFRYAIYDPTYYVEVLHTENHIPTIDGDLDCNVVLIEPNPTPEMVELAYALDIDAQAPDTLGEMFSETAVIRCP